MAVITVMEREDPAGSISSSDDSKFQSTMSLCTYLRPQRALSSGCVEATLVCCALCVSLLPQRPRHGWRWKEWPLTPSAVRRGLCPPDRQLVSKVDFDIANPSAERVGSNTPDYLGTAPYDVAVFSSSPCC